MANIENLQPFTKENAKYYGKKGGIKSGIVRAERKSIKEQMQLLLSMPVLSQNKANMLLEAGFDETEINNQLLLTYTIFQKALTGDVKATSLVFKTIQNEDNEKSNAFNDTLNDLFNIWSVKKAREILIISISLAYFYIN